MARGWESKSVEAQQDEAARRGPAKRPLSEAERQVADRRRTLELTRARAVDDLNRATAPEHRRMLEHAIQAIEDQLKSLR
jgi:hypothetical protein